MEIKSFYDASSQTLRVEYRNNLIKNIEYRDVLYKKIKKSDFPGGTEIEDISDNCISLSIPIKIDESTIKNGVGKLDPHLAELLTDTFNNFVTECLNKEVRSTEIIPLKGYPLQSLKEDIKEAITQKRNFCVIDTYENYKKFNERESVSLNQVKFKYLSDEYCDLAIEIETATDMNAIISKYTPLLEVTNWV